MNGLKKNLLLILLVISFTSCAQHRTIAVANNSSDYAEINLDGIEKDILFYINQYRESIGKDSLQMFDAASKEAAAHSADMATGITSFGHEGFEKRITNIAVSFGNLHGAAENVASGMLTAKAVVNGWLHSAAHKKNIEGDYSFTGIGVAKDKQGIIFFTQIFLRK